MVERVERGSATASVTTDGKTATSSSSSSSSPLMHIEGLLEALTVADKDGRIVVDRRGDSICLPVTDLLSMPCQKFGRHSSKISR